MSQECQEYQEYQEEPEDKKENCSCFSFLKRKRTFEDGISSTAYIPYIPYIRQSACIPDYSNPIAEYYYNEVSNTNRRCKFCSIIINFFF